MTPMNNPIAMLLNIARSGGNPMAAMQQMANNNPQMRQAMQMMQGKSPAELQQMAQNIARERGIDLNDFIRNLGKF